MNNELENFRREWKEEVTARTRGENSARRRSFVQVPTRKTQPLESESKPPDDFDDLAKPYDLDGVDDGRVGELRGVAPSSDLKGKDPVSALEHYEKAVERETEGSLGESLTHYRKAYRLDHRVDQEYKKKHFPAPSTAVTNPRTNPSNASPTVPNTAHHSLHGPNAPIAATSELLAACADASIESALPEIEVAPPKPCHISRLPAELLAEILLMIALSDVATTARLALVCKRLAYLVATEDRLWKRLCLGKEYGFGAMRFAFAEPLDTARIVGESIPDIAKLALDDSPMPAPLTLSLSPSYPTYRAMFRSRPRLRFAGVYISTVNYVRPGASSPNQISWNTPVHIVTYYRYLRFYRDGSCISLLTTTEPSEVVPHLHASNMPGSGGRAGKPGSASGTGPSPEATTVMKQALPGKWRLAPLADAASLKGASDRDDEWANEPEGHLHVETAGPTPAYTYSLHLAMRSAAGAGGPRNTKLVWQSFWSYNRLTDDWAEFRLRNDRAFVWSRVKSWADA